MHPTLIPLQLFGQDLPIRSYGVLLLLGVAVGLVWVLREAPRHGVNRGLAIDLTFCLLVGGLLGARLLYLGVHADRYLLACLDPERFADVHGPARLAPLTRNPDCWAALRVWEGGLVWYGGLLGALAAIWLFCWGKGALEPAARPGRPSLAVLADLFVPAAALGHAFGRLGCFAAGCCWGRPATLPWSVSFPAGSMAWNQQLEQGLIPGWADASLPVHPTQLYEAGGELLIFFFLLVGLRTGQHLRRPGQLAMTWAVLYPLLRSLVELFRADEERGALLRWGSATVAGWLGLPPGTWLLLSWGQAVSLVVASVALALLLRQQGQR